MRLRKSPKKPKEIVTLVDLGAGKIPERVADLAFRHPKKRFEAVDKATPRRRSSTINAIRKKAMPDLKRRPDSSVKIINTDFLLSHMILKKLEKRQLKVNPEKPIPRAFLRQVRRVLVPNGRFYITTEKTMAKFYLPQLRKFFGEKNVSARPPSPAEIKTHHMRVRLEDGVEMIRIVCANRKGRRA